jgi:NitT/TauT family transport system permease protein
VSDHTATGQTAVSATAAEGRAIRLRRLRLAFNRASYFVAGLALLFGLWWLAIFIASLDPASAHWIAFGPVPALQAMGSMWSEGVIQAALFTSGYRMGAGLAIAIAIGVPIGILLGRSRRFREIANSPFQLLRMVSPMSWEPIAVIVFAGWEPAIIFLIAIGAVWSIMFSTAAGLAKVDPAWYKVARNLGAKPWQIVTRIIVPAIAFDVLTGLRLAVGVAWIVLVPAEFLGVRSGLGFTIQDARETLEFDRLMATILVIGAVGYLMDSALVALIRRYSWHKQ